jgi:hypothetical protein
MARSQYSLPKIDAENLYRPGITRRVDAGPREYHQGDATRIMGDPAGKESIVAAKPNRGDPRGMAAYIRETAQKYGIDPEVALRVAKSEGLSTFQSSVPKSGKGSHQGREDSWGAFQLYMGGGLGNAYQKATGKDPRDPANEKDTIDYALKHAAQHGWGAWHGAKNTGIGEYEGIGAGAKTAAADAASGYGGIGSDAAASERAASTKIEGTDTSTRAPDVSQAAPGAATGDFLDRLKNSPGAATGLGEAIGGLGQAVAGTGLAPAAAAAAPARSMTVPAPALQAPAGVVPMVDPRAVENQRQQLATAMQRLNSGRLY